MDTIIYAFGAITLISGFVLGEEKIMKMAFSLFLMGLCSSGFNYLSLMVGDPSLSFLHPENKTICTAILIYAGTWSIPILHIVLSNAADKRKRRKLKMTSNLKILLKGRLDLDKILVNQLKKIGVIQAAQKGDSEEKV